jgi:hypothetical protein
MRKAKIQEVSKQLFEISHDTRKFVNQPSDDAVSFEIAVNKAKELDITFFELYGSNESKYLEEMDKHILLERSALEETMETLFPQIVRLIKDGFIRFFCI